MPAKLASSNRCINNRNSGKSTCSTARPSLCTTSLMCLLSSAMLRSPNGMILLNKLRRQPMVKSGTPPEAVKKCSLNSSASFVEKVVASMAFRSLSILSCCSSSLNLSMNCTNSRKSKLPEPLSSKSLTNFLTIGLFAGSCAICGKQSSNNNANSRLPMSPLPSRSYLLNFFLKSTTSCAEKPPLSRKACLSRRLHTIAVRMKPSQSM
mmetsp:Transcript_44225/g.111155  ORF Transcript_44225/g.111155 Transcript_44225/m.111155 type:complete len:208 (+) Transcript_44225:118-741(+)